MLSTSASGREVRQDIKDGHFCHKMQWNEMQNERTGHVYGIFSHSPGESKDAARMPYRRNADGVFEAWLTSAGRFELLETKVAPRDDMDIWKVVPRRQSFVIDREMLAPGITAEIEAEAEALRELQAAQKLAVPSDEGAEAPKTQDASCEAPCRGTAKSRRKQRKAEAKAAQQAHAAQPAPRGGSTAHRDERQFQAWLDNLDMQQRNITRDMMGTDPQGLSFDGNGFHWSW